jgi:hypothetical protein
MLLRLAGQGSAAWLVPGGGEGDQGIVGRATEDLPGG